MSTFLLTFLLIVCLLWVSASVLTLGVHILWELQGVHMCVVAVHACGPCLCGPCLWCGGFLGQAQLRLGEQVGWDVLVPGLKSEVIVRRSGIGSHLQTFCSL